MYADLAEAVRVEAASAVRFFWGVGWDTVWKWRQALGVGPVTEGTSRLKSENARGEAGEATRQALLAKMSDPELDRERREKIAAAKRGKPCSRSEGAVPHSPFGGHKHTEEARRKMSETRRDKRLRPPRGKVWTAGEDELVRTLPVAEVVQRTGRTLTSVYSRRGVLRVPDGRSKVNPA